LFKQVIYSDGSSIISCSVLSVSAIVLPFLKKNKNQTTSTWIGHKREKEQNQDQLFDHFDDQ